MKKPRIYISGPMTGLPEYNFPAFHAAAAAWRAAGWDAVNPADSFEGDTTRTYREYVREDMRLLKTCDAIAMLPGWDGENARGSVWEREVALDKGITVYDATIPVAAPLATIKDRGGNKNETVLEEAQRLVHGDRNAAYGHPRIDYKATGRMFGAILERWLGREIPDVPPRIAALMMVAVKVSREAGKHKRDNCTDMAGYAECVNWIADSEEAA